MDHLWLFAAVFFSQVGHLVEHIAKAVAGQGLLGTAADSELSHLLFNGLIAILAVALVRKYAQNPWVYPLALLSLLHGVEHIYIYAQFLRTGLVDGPGLLGFGGVIGLIPIPRLDLHNLYNGFEVVLMTLGLAHETESAISVSEE